MRGIWQATTGGVYAVAGSGVYKVSTADWSAVHLGDITSGLHTPVSMADNGLELVIVDGSASGWKVTLAGDVFAPITEPAFYGADRVQFLDTYFLFNKPGTPQFYVSDSLATTFDPLWFADKETFSDELITIAVVRHELWLLGSRVSEVWFNAGGSGTIVDNFPFQRQQTAIINHGCAAKHSAAVYENSVAFLGRDRAGQGVVWHSKGYEATRISTFAIEHALMSYERIDDAIGFFYSLGGHVCYVLTFPTADATWAYDVSSGQWHEWLWLDVNGEEHRHRSNCCAAIDGKPIVGDWHGGQLYALDAGVFTDNGAPIKRQRAFPHILNDGNRAFYREFQADMDLGNPSPPPTIITSEEKIVTWLPWIAQMTGVAVGAISPTTGGMFVDWPRGIVYAVGQTGYQKYTTTLETQTPLVTVATPSRFVLAGDIDPLSGALLLQTSTSLPNAIPISKIDPNTFAVLDTFGVPATFPSYPTSVWGGQSIVCVVCNGVSFGFLKYSQFSGAVAGFRVDTMEHAGFIADIVAGSTNNRGFMIAGKSGGPSASVFLSWDATTVPRPAVPLYRIDIAASATAYDPTSWPATNPGITWTTVGTVPVAAVDPAWAGITVESLGYDLADGNVLMLVGTSSTADGYRIMKLNSATAAIMWNIHIGMTVINLSGSRINGSLWMFANPGAGAGPTSSYRINTLTGEMETQSLSGVFAQAGSQQQQTDSDTTTLLFGGRFIAISNSPVPVEGTAPYENGWAVMGGQTVIATTTTSKDTDNLISLEWSDDRGHSWGNPVTQPMTADGDYDRSLVWRRLGMARDRVFRLSWSCATATALQGAWISVTPEKR